MLDNKHKKIILFVICCLFFGLSVSQGQDIHFSQFYASPLNLNPANTGMFNSKRDYRVALNYRNQWRSISAPFVTYAMSYDMEALQEKLDGDKIGVGLAVLKDKAGDGDLSVTKVLLSGAFHKYVNKDKTHVISFGFQPGLIFKGIDFNKLVFGNQLTDDGFDGNLTNNEPVTNTSTTALDLNAGLAWSMQVKDNLTLTSGISLSHINRAKDQFLGTGNQISRKTMFNVGSIIGLSDKIDFTPSLLFERQRKSTEVNLAAIINIKMKTNNKYIRPEFIYFAGLQSRLTNGDAMILVTGVEAKHLRIGISYDVNVSNLTVASNGKGGIELSLVYLGIFPKFYKIEKVVIPCVRF